MSDKVAINDFETFYEKEQGQTKVFYGWDTAYYPLKPNLLIQDTGQSTTSEPLRFNARDGFNTWDSATDKFVKKEVGAEVEHHMVFKNDGVYVIEYQLVFVIPVGANPDDDQVDFMYGIFLEDGRSNAQRIGANIKRYVASGNDPNFAFVITNSSMTRFFNKDDHIELWFYLLGPTGSEYRFQGTDSGNSVVSYVRISKLY